MSPTRWLAVLLIVLVAFLLRTYQLAEIPAGLYFDEIDAGYAARSILQTGKDYRGTFSPFFINSFVDPRPPLPIYVMVLSTALFKTPELQVRMGAALLSTVNICLIFSLIYLWTKKPLLAFITAGVFATNPWQIQFARFSHEANTVLFLLLLAWIFFFLALTKKKWWLLLFFGLFLGFSMYAYRTMSLFSPLVFISTWLVYRQEVWRLAKTKLLWVVGLYLIVVGPFLYFSTIGAKDTPRINQISIISDAAIPIQVQRNRELDSGDAQHYSIGKKPIFYSFLFHNKLVSFSTEFAKNYYSAFSVDFLFLNGDKNHRHSIPDQGMLYYIDILAIGFGLYYLFKNVNQKEVQLTLVLLFLGPVPASLTQDGAAHSARMFVYLLPMLIVVGYGWWRILSIFRRLKLKGVAVLSGIVLIWSLLFIFYLHSYFVHFAYSSARWHSYGYKQVVEKIQQVESQYNKVVMVPTFDPPILFLLFWGNIPPKETQMYGSNFSEEKPTNERLNKYKAAALPQDNIPELIKAMSPDTLYLVTQKELSIDLRFRKPPEGIKVVEVITYPDKEVAFYLITKVI